jgi:ABC-type molybdate transport system substrate-binding protein
MPLLATGAAVAGLAALAAAAEYPIAVVKASRHRAAAEAFVESAASGRVHRELLDRGFQPAP